VRKTLLLIAAVLLCGSAYSFPVEIEAVNRTNNWEQSAEFNLEVQNTFEANRTFKPRLKDTSRTWWFYERNFKELRSGKNHTFAVTVNATEEAENGRHNFTMEVKTLEEERSQTQDYFILKKPEKDSDEDKKIQKNNNNSKPSQKKQEEREIESLILDRETVQKGYSKELKIQVSNPNNQTVTKTVSQSIPFYLAPLATNSPSPDKAEFVNNSKVMEWDLEVSPSGEKTLKTSINYLLFFGGLIVLFGSMGILKVMKGSIKLEKEIKREGELTKILLHLENHTKKPVRDLKIKDFIPSVLEEDEFMAGKPMVTKTEHGTRLEWEIEKIEPGETRKLIYTVKPKFEQESTIQLPEAEVLIPKKSSKESCSKEVDFKPEEE